MELLVSFSDIKAFIDDGEPELLPVTKSLLGVLLILSPLAVGLPLAAVEPGLGLLALTNELSEAGQKLNKWLRRKPAVAEQPGRRLRRLELAYASLAFSAFFDALDTAFAEILDAADIDDDDKRRMLADALQAESPLHASTEAVDAEALLRDLTVRLPHPLDSFSAQTGTLLALYERLADGFLRFLSKLSLWDAADFTTRDRYTRAASALSLAALKRVRDHYFQLALENEEFFIWSSLHEVADARYVMHQVSTAIKRQADLSNRTAEQLDLGFRALGNAIDSVAASQRKAPQAIAQLMKAYAQIPQEPIVAHNALFEGASNTFVSPTKSSIFVPQAFRVLRYDGKSSLEDESTWTGCETRQDLSHFILKWLSSPYSCSSPLLVLGHPGSGKSLLTEMLVATLTRSPYTPIRLRLRDVDPDDDVPEQISRYLRAHVGAALDWLAVADHLVSRPPVVVLDGYDELLQASGRTFAGYLNKVRAFQGREASFERPLRAVVTSRLTLIDNVNVPSGTLVIRLQEFDDLRVTAWVTAWNSSNKTHFRDASVKPFSLPHVSQVVELARHPLLLFMLALYDASNNELAKLSVDSPARLYHALISSFVQRERFKNEQVRELPPADQAKAVDQDIERLGVTALAMFNRRALHIAADELTKDIGYFQQGRPLPETTRGRQLSQAELLIGSFFFVQESVAQAGNERRRTQERDDVAFEFLHNTFGEFLVADFILRAVVREAKAIHRMSQVEDLGAVLAERLDDQRSVGRAWYGSLCNSLLHSRPVIVDLMRQWLPWHLERESIAATDFSASLGAIASRQFNAVTMGDGLPFLIAEPNRAPFPPLSAINRLATYTLNLLVVQALSTWPKAVQVEALCPEAQWIVLTQLWKAGLELSTLSDAASILEAKPGLTGLQIALRPKFEIPRTTSTLQWIRNIRHAVDDVVWSGLAVFSEIDIFRDGLDRLASEQSELRAAGVDVRAAYLRRAVRYYREGEVPPWLTNEATALFERSEWLPPEKALDLLEAMSGRVSGLELSSMLRPWIATAIAINWWLTSPEFAERLYETAHRLKWAQLSIEFGQLDRSMLARFNPEIDLNPFVPDTCLRRLRLARAMRNVQVRELMFARMAEALRPKRTWKIDRRIAIEAVACAAQHGGGFPLSGYVSDLCKFTDDDWLVEVDPPLLLSILKQSTADGNQDLLRRWVSMAESTKNSRFARFGRAGHIRALLGIVEAIGDDTLIERARKSARI